MTDRRLSLLVDRVMSWRWAPFLSWVMLVVAIAYTFYIQDRNDRDSDRGRYDLCTQADRERQSLYDLLTLRPISTNTPVEQRLKIEHAQWVFSQPTDCEGLLRR